MRPGGGQIAADGIVFLGMDGRLMGKAGGRPGIRPAWTPDGKYIYAINYELGMAVERWDSGGRNRMVIPVTGLAHTTRMPPTDASRFLQMMSFSPSGNLAALLTQDFKEMLIVDVGKKQMVLRDSLPAGFSYVAQSVWLDDEHLLFIGKRTSTVEELWELDVRTGTAVRRGINGLALRDYISLSPDKKSIVVTGTKDGAPVSWNLWQFSLKTSKLTRLTTGTLSEDIEPAWIR